VWALTVVYDLNFVAFRSRDTMAESLVFASEDGVFKKIGFILVSVSRYVHEDERAELLDMIRSGREREALEFYQDLAWDSGEPVSFWWNRVAVED